MVRFITETFVGKFILRTESNSAISDRFDASLTFSIFKIFSIIKFFPKRVKGKIYDRGSKRKKGICWLGISWTYMEPRYRYRMLRRRIFTQGIIQNLAHKYNYRSEPSVDSSPGYVQPLVESDLNSSKNEKPKLPESTTLKHCHTIYAHSCFSSGTMLVLTRPLICR